MVEVIKKFGIIISSAMHLDENAENSRASGTVSPTDSKPLPELPQSIQVNVVLPSLADEFKDVLGDSVVNDRKPHGAECLKPRNPERYMNLPKELSAEMKSLHQALTEEVKGFGGGYYLYPKKIVDIPPELSHQVRNLHEVLNQEIPHGAELLHPKEIVEIPAALSQDVRGLRGALNREILHGADILHPKEIVQVPPDLSSEIRKLHETLNVEVVFGAEYLHPKQIVEIPSELDHETQDLHSALNNEVKQFGHVGHLHPKRIAEIPVDLSQQVRELHEALNEAVVQVGGPKNLHPKEIVEIPAEVANEVKNLHAGLVQEIKLFGGPDLNEIQDFLQPKGIVEVPGDLCQEAKYLHEILMIEVRCIGVGPRLLHPKKITEIPPELCREIREAHKHLNEEVSHGAYPLHPKKIVEIPVELNQQIRDLHDDLIVEIEHYGGADRLHDDAGMDRSLEPPNELSESVKQQLRPLTKEIKNFDKSSKLRYAGQPNQYKHDIIAPKPMDMAAFQTYVEELLNLLASSGSAALTPSNTATSNNSSMNECVDRVVNTLVEAAKKLRDPIDNKTVLVEELNRRRGNIDVDDGAPANVECKDLSKDENRQAFVDEDSNQENGGAHDSGLFEEKAKEPAVPAVVFEEKGFVKKNTLLRRLSGWKASHATLIDEAGAAELAHGKEKAKDSDGKHIQIKIRPARPMQKFLNLFRKNPHKHVNAVDVAVPVV